ncbi:MAG: YARHG domain-containing protein, partial [Myxococcales bacterium]|nr:YARHG domain-containing protein [Myxococcales bacterium]
YVGQTRPLTLQVRVPTKGPQEGLVGQVRLRYEPVEGGDAIERQADVRYVLTPSLAKVDAAAVPVYMVAADRMRVSHVLIDAAAMLKEGDLLEAQALMRDERARLEARKGRLDGAARDEVEALIALFHDAYADADLSGKAASAPAVDLGALVQRVWDGNLVRPEELTGLDAEALRRLRNAAYARHGYVFKDASLTAFFGRRGDYRPDPAFTPKRLGKMDVVNVALINEYEGRASIVAAARVDVVKPGPGFEALLGRARAGEGISEADLGGLSLTELRLLRNAVYARHGYAFRSHDLQTFFAKAKWYAPDPAYTPNRLSPEDGKTVRTIKSIEQRILARAGTEALRDFELRNRAKAREAVR